jgi:hypothetical protein
MTFFNNLSLRARRFYQEAWGYPFFLLLVGFLTSLYPLWQLGYYWDDWEVVYLTRLATPSALEAYFFFDRPLAWPYTVYASVLGASPILWHVLTLLLRWAGTLFFYRALLLLWPRQRSVLQWGGLLMLVYPAFLQQSISTAFSRHFTAFMLCGLSFYFTALAMRTNRKALFWFLAWVTGTAQIFTIEYFAGLELVRPVFIWLLLDGSLGHLQKLKRTVLLWLPFLGVFLVFGWWRVAYYPTLLSTQQFVSRARFVSSFLQNPLVAVLGLLQSIWLDFWFLLNQSWLALVTDSTKIDLMAASVWFALGMALVLGLLAGYLTRTDDDGSRGFGAQAFWLGLAGLLAGGIPVWIIERRASAAGNFDSRFAIGMLFGAVLLLVALIWSLVQARWRAWVLAFLFALGVFTQVYVVNGYRREWANELNYFWQLSWRVPGLKTGTAILGGYVPSPMLPDYDAGFALALLYSGQKTGTQLPYWYFTWDGFGNVKLKDGAQADVTFRNLEFKGTIGQSVMVFNQPLPGCIRVADGFYSGDPALGPQNNLLGYSDLSRIESTASQAPDPAIFGPEPARGWCYYYQKADLARQLGQWEQVVKLYKQADVLGFSSNQGGEYLPLLEAYAQSSQWNQAYKTSKAIVELTQELGGNVCAKWARYTGLPGLDLNLAASLHTELACP